MTGHACEWLTIRTISDTAHVEVCTVCLTSRLVTHEEAP